MKTGGGRRGVALRTQSFIAGVRGALRPSTRLPSPTRRHRLCLCHLETHTPALFTSGCSSAARGRVHSADTSSLCAEKWNLFSLALAHGGCRVVEQSYLNNFTIPIGFRLSLILINVSRERSTRRSLGAGRGVCSISVAGATAADRRDPPPAGRAAAGAGAGRRPRDAGMQSPPPLSPAVRACPKRFYCEPTRPVVTILA
ncbi:hypothetical protein EVAR_80492_1 [Eumeta japonica]|uniref:Uncharacterized protein n=1 Tax=Eumeta variegata TaxID=151549 RepID=A0A4C1ZIG6_EUMVA|nr:hypothetical protein EVAR_80492_1 [Eumeta japonica]